MQKNGRFGMWVYGANTVTGCTAWLNGSSGFRVDSGSTISGCVSSANVGHGIELSGDCNAVNNNCSQNGFAAANAAGIYVNGVENRIEGNAVTFNDRGIEVANSGNLVIRNSARGNTINYVIVALNKVGVIVSAPNSAAISGSTGGAGVGTTDPWANISF
jgi:parallel beta-helix repeat protein